MFATRFSGSNFKFGRCASKPPSFLSLKSSKSTFDLYNKKYSFPSFQPQQVKKFFATHAKEETKVDHHEITANHHHNDHDNHNDHGEHHDSHDHHHHEDIGPTGYFGARKVRLFLHSHLNSLN